MSALSKISRTLALAVVVAPLLAQSAQAKYVAVKWDPKKFPNVFCVSISTFGPYGWEQIVATKSYGVDPKHGFLTTKYSVGGYDSFFVELHKIRDCSRHMDPTRKYKVFYYENGKSTGLEYGKKYVYANFL